MLTTFLLLVTNVHATLGATIITAAVFIYLIKNNQRRWALTVVLSVFGGMLLNVLLKNIFHRARPHFDNPILTLTSYGFPSGHTMMATCLYGVLGAFAVSKLKAWRRALAVVAASFLILLVGFSRIYLGAHYLSDVLGAMAEGLVWLAFCLTAVNMIRHRLRSSR
jgi:undecaprenyl-diphosphatase